MRPRTRIALGVSGALPVLALVTGPNTTLLIYTIYVVALLWRDHLTVALARVPVPPRVLFVALVLLSGWLAECLAWLSSYLARNPHPALLHPQLGADLILAIGFYGGWAIAWLLLLHRWRFGLGQIFIITGLMGIVVEQSGAVLAIIVSTIVADPLLAVLYGLDIFCVYGSIMGLAMVGILSRLTTDRQRRRNWAGLLLAPFMMYLGSALLLGAVTLITDALRILPPRRSITTHPFW